jgi:hypothetical protein
MDAALKIPKGCVHMQLKLLIFFREFFFRKLSFLENYISLISLTKIYT